VLSQVPPGVAATALTLPAEAVTARRIALAGDVLALAEGTRVTLYDVARERVLRTLELAWDVHEVVLAPSARFVAAGPRQPRAEIAVHDLERDATTPIGKLADRWLTGVEFARADGAEVLLVARDQRTFTIFDTGDELRELAVVESHGFEFDSFSSLPDGFVASVGHYSGETRDSLVVIPIEEADRRRAAEAVREELDFAYRLIAGQAESDAFVAFRDPEDAEEPDPDDEDDDGRSDVHNFHGLYVRDVRTRELRERIAWDGPVAPGDRCFATERWIAIAMRDRLTLVPRRDANAELTIPADAVALDPDGRRVALASRGGRLDLLAL
jgi:hypothetical protein